MELQAFFIRFSARLAVGARGGCYGHTAGPGAAATLA
jgi:hypothetical protein